MKQKQPDPAIGVKVDRDITADLIPRIKAGHYHLFDRVIAAYQQPLFGFLYQIVKDEDDARDLCQDTFFKAYKSIRSFKGEAKFSTWLFRIGYRRALNFIRRKKRSQEVGSQVDPPSNPGHTQRQLEVTEIKVIIDHIVQEMTPPYRAALHLFYRQEKRYEEIAAIMKIPLNSVKSHIYRAKAAIRQRLLEEYRLPDIQI